MVDMIERVSRVILNSGAILDLSEEEARSIANAIADEGLLPTGKQWGTAPPGTVVAWDSEERARTMHELIPAHPLKVRYGVCN